jgi:hypothetical protein
MNWCCNTVCQTVLLHFPINLTLICKRKSTDWQSVLQHSTDWKSVLKLSTDWKSVLPYVVQRNHH